MVVGCAQMSAGNATAVVEQSCIYAARSQVTGEALLVKMLCSVPRQLCRSQILLGESRMP